MNKTTAAIFLFTFLMFNSLTGQFNLNISSGINYSNYEFNNEMYDFNTAELGYFVEVAPAFKLNKKLNLLLNSQFNLKSYRVNNQDVIPDAKVRLTYIDILPELEFKVVKFLDLGIGLNYGFNIKYEQKNENGDWEDIENDNFEKTDFGLTGKIKFSHKNVFAFVRYSHGLKGLLDIEFRDINGEIMSESELKSKNIQVGVGYTLSF